jgi:hypothetical protein
MHAVWADRRRRRVGRGRRRAHPRAERGCPVVVSPRPPWRRTRPPRSPGMPSTDLPGDAVDLVPRRQHRAPVERTAPQLHPPRHPQPAGPRPQPVSHVRGDVRRLGRLRRRGFDGVVFTERHPLRRRRSDREIAMSYAAYRVLSHRYAPQNGGRSRSRLLRHLHGRAGPRPGRHPHRRRRPDRGRQPRRPGGDRHASSTTAPTRRTAYADTTGWGREPGLVVDRAGTPATGSRPLAAAQPRPAETQNGIVLDKQCSRTSAHTGARSSRSRGARSRHEPVLRRGTTTTPSVMDPEMVDWVVEVIAQDGELDPTDRR